MANGPLKMIRSIGGNGPQPFRSSNSIPFHISRWFARNETTRYATIPEVTLAGDEFGFTVDGLTTNAGGYISLYNDNADQYIQLNIGSGSPAGTLKIATNGYTPGNGSQVVDDGSFHKVEVTINRLTGLISVFVDDALDYSVTHSNPSSIGNSYRFALGAKLASTAGSPIDNLNGILANLKIYDKSESVENVAGLGGELVVNGDFSDGANGWTAVNAATLDAANGTMVVTAGVETNPQIRQVIDTVVGQQYLVTGILSESTTSNTQIFSQGHVGDFSVTGFSTITTDTPSPASFVFTALTTKTRIAYTLLGTDPGSTFTADDISVREVTSFNKLVRDYPLDDNSDILRNRATVLSGELYSAGLADWLSPRGNSSISESSGVVIATADTAATFGQTRELSGLSVGETYLIHCKYKKNYAGGQVYLRFDDAVAILSGTLSDTTSQDEVNVSVIVAATASTMYLGVVATSPTAGDSIQLSDISIRQAGGYGTVINGNADDWGLFQQQVTGEWLGQELVVNGGFDSDSGWTLGAGWSIGAGVANSSGSAVLGIYQTSVLYQASFRVFTEITSINSGVLGVAVGGVDTGTRASFPAQVGPHLLDIDISGNTNGTVILGSDNPNNFTGSIDNISIREVLNVA